MRKTLLTLAMAFAISTPIAQAVDWTLSSVTNVAQGGEVTVSSNGGNATQIVDNNTGNGWQASANAVGADWALIKLNSTSSIGVVQVVWEASSATEYRVMALAEAPEYTSTEEGAEVQENTIANIESVAANAIKVVTFTAEAQNGNRFDEMEFAAEGVNYLLVYVDKESGLATTYGSYIREVRAAQKIENENEAVDIALADNYSLVKDVPVEISIKFLNGYGNEIPDYVPDYRPTIYQLNINDESAFTKTYDNNGIYTITPLKTGNYIFTAQYRFGNESDPTSLKNVNYIANVVVKDNWLGYSISTKTNNDNVVATMSDHATYGSVANLVDGDESTAAGFGDGTLQGDETALVADVNWWVIDLGGNYDITAFNIVWEGGFANDYDLEFLTASQGADINSLDWSQADAAKTINIVCNTAEGVAHNDEYYVQGDAVTARYVRIVANKAVKLAYGAKIKEVYMMGEKKVITDTEIASMELTAPEANADGSYTLTVIAKNAEGEELSAVSGIEFDSSVVASAVDNGDGSYNITLKEGLFGVLTITATAGDLTATTTLDVLPDWSGIGTTVYSYCTTTWNPGATAYGSSNTSEIHTAALANDGTLTTRWEIHDGSLSPDADSNWWYVDLGRNFDINSFKILWEMAYCKTYELQFIAAEHVTNPANIDWNGENVTTFTRTISNPTVLTNEEKLALGMTNPNDPTVPSGDNCFWEEFVMPTMTARYVRINGVEYAEEYGNANNGGCMKILEVLMTGPEQSLFTTPTAMVLEPNAFEVGTTLDAKIVAYNELGSKISGIEYAITGVEITDNSYVEGLDNATLTYEGNGQFTATEVGGHLVKVTAKDASGTEFVFDNVLVEALVPDWSLRTNIAKQFELKDNASVDVAFGYNKGNPLSTAYASHGGSTALNSIDASGNSKWVVTQADIAENGNVWWLVDLGADYNVSALELVWGQYSYAKQFDVYMAGDDGSGHPTWYPATAETLAGYLAYSENNATPEIKDGYAYENHAVVLQKARYIMIKPTQTRDGNSSYELAEVLVYGPNEEANTLKIMTPQFDRSREGYRGYDDPEVATSVNASDPLILSFEALTTFGSEWYNPDNYDVVWNVKFNGIAVDSESENGYTITVIDRQVRWRDYTWKYPFLFRPKQVGTYTVSLTISEKNGTGTWTSDELSVYSVTANKNVARYAEPKENNVEVYGGGGEPNRNANDLRFDRDDTNNDQPNAAIDGNYGSWYVVGYHYRSLDEAGVEGYGYKYPANTTLEKPYELIIKYPEGLYLKEMNLVEVQWEGAYAKDYEVWVQYADVTETGATNGYPATGDWERVAAYTDLHMPGIDQHETQQIYKNTGETAVAARAASFEAWHNVKAVKIVMQKTGTEWGFKMWETSVYGLLNEQPVTVSAEQMVYADPAGTTRATDTSDRYYSFDVELKVDEYPSALDLTQIKNYRIVSTIETNLDPVHNMLSHYSYVNDGGTERNRGPIIQIVNGVTREKTFEPFVVAANADGTMPNVMIEDVDPFGGYQFAVYPIGAYDEAAGTYADLGNEYAGASSNIVSLVAPTVTYSASKMTIEKMDTEKEKFVIHDYGTVVGNVLHGNSSLPQEIQYANRIRTTDGEFTEVKLIDRTLDDWEVKYQVYMYLTDVTGKAKDVSGADTDEPFLRYYYTSNGGQENFVYNNDGSINKNAIAMNQDKPLTLNRGNMSADLFYLPATITEKKVAIDGAPDDVNALTYNQFEVADLSARITVYMYYTRLDLAHERGVYERSKFTSQMCRVKSSEVPLTLKYEDQTAGKLANITAGNNPKIVAQVLKYNESQIEDVYDIHSYYCAFNSIDINSAEDLNRYVGYHMSNGYSYENNISGGIASAENSGNNAPWYIEGFYNQEEGETYADKHNANLMASNSNHVALRLSKVGAVDKGLVDGKVEDEVDDIYTVLFAEYPILLQQPIDGGQVYNSTVYRPRPAIIGEKTYLDDYRANGGIATAAVDAIGTESRVFPNVDGESGYFDIKIQNVGNYTHVVQDLSGATTEIEDVENEAVGDFRIYPNPAVDVVNVAASMELGRVEIYSIDGSLVKVVEADDTQAQIAVGDLSKGTYIVRAVGKTERLIKM